LQSLLLIYGRYVTLRRSSYKYSNALAWFFFSRYYCLFPVVPFCCNIFTYRFFFFPLACTYFFFQAGGKELAILILIFSGIWPYTKQLITLVVWFLPPSMLSISKRGSILLWVDWDPLRRLKLTQGSKIFGSNYHHNLVVQDLHLYDYNVIQALKNDSFEFDHIESLGFSFRVDSPMIRNEPSSISLQNIFTCLLPNLLELDVTDVGANFEQLIKNCPLLKKVRLHNVQASMKVSLYGTRMKTVRVSRWSGNAWNSYSTFTCLKELYMDNGVFVCEDSHIFDLNNQQQKHIFTFFCSNSLTRVSLKNASYRLWNRRKNAKQELSDETMDVPQDALIKFVRNSPALQWFKSDLTAANTVMLHQEYPVIGFVN
jgi:hypothetical protein